MDGPYDIAVFYQIPLGEKRWGIGYYGFIDKDLVVKKYRLEKGDHTWDYVVPLKDLDTKFPTTFQKVEEVGLELFVKPEVQPVVKPEVQLVLQPDVFGSSADLDHQKENIRLTSLLKLRDKEVAELHLELRAKKGEGKLDIFQHLIEEGVSIVGGHYDALALGKFEGHLDTRLSCLDYPGLLLKNPTLLLQSFKQNPVLHDMVSVRKSFGEKLEKEDYQELGTVYCFIMLLENTVYLHPDRRIEVVQVSYW